jgi:hypothetical protein
LLFSESDKAAWSPNETNEIRRLLALPYESNTCSISGGHRFQSRDAWTPRRTYPFRDGLIHPCGGFGGEDHGSSFFDLDNGALAETGDPLIKSLSWSSLGFHLTAGIWRCPAADHQCVDHCRAASVRGREACDRRKAAFPTTGPQAEQARAKGQGREVTLKRA